jgi:hypothetical protein
MTNERPNTEPHGESPPAEPDPRDPRRAVDLHRYPIERRPDPRGNGKESMRTGSKRPGKMNPGRKSQSGGQSRAWPDPNLSMPARDFVSWRFAASAEGSGDALVLQASHLGHRLESSFPFVGDQPAHSGCSPAWGTVEATEKWRLGHGGTAVRRRLISGSLVRVRHWEPTIDFGCVAGA